ncbi:MAG: arginine--tRNA ligase [Deltaproteobacteria bacterium]|nr:arginine--tRNA ligase [Deltaproteobacteria bacterium]
MGSMVSVQQSLQQVLRATLEECKDAGLFRCELPEIAISRPKRAEHGDFATNIALVLAQRAGRPPRALAEEIVGHLVDPEGMIAQVDVAGPGFLNFRIADAYWLRLLGEVLHTGDEFGRGSAASPGRINVEFVSANPTGPLHVGHGRGAAVGDALCRLLRFAGYHVGSEYYVNDAGNQVAMLARSTWVRYMELLCERDPSRGPAPALPEDGYQGEYVRDIALQLLERDGERWAGAEPPGDLEPIREFAVFVTLEWIRATLQRFRVEFDHWFSERTLHQSGALQRWVDALKARGLVKDEDGALWLKTTEMGTGDDKDRVLRKSDGEWTYTTADLAYHANKLERGFGHLIDIWGADHHGYVPRMKAVMKAAGAEPSQLEALLVQFVTLLQGGEKVAMGKRSGKFETLDDVIDEVGIDAARFFFLTRRHDSHIDFDLELAKKQSLDNPVFYVQYGYARACAILRRAAELGIDEAPYSLELSERLKLPEEINVLRRLADFPTLVAEAAAAREPHRLVFFLTELAQDFQSYYTRLQKVHGDTVLPQRRHREGDWQATWDFDKTRARLLWVRAIRQVMKNALALLGVEAPERMERMPAEAAAGPDEDEVEDDAGEAKA